MQRRGSKVRSHAFFYNERPVPLSETWQGDRSFVRFWLSPVGMESQEVAVRFSAVISCAMLDIGLLPLPCFTLDEERCYFRSIFRPHSVPGIMNKPLRTVINARTPASDRAEARPLMATLSSVVPT